MNMGVFIGAANRSAQRLGTAASLKDAARDLRLDRGHVKEKG
jgi:hypothetical protein